MTHATPNPLVPLLTYQRHAVESDARFLWSCWARQTGKSFTFALRRILRGLQRQRNQIFLSASERQSRELMQKAMQHFQTLQLAVRQYNCDYFDNTGFKQLEITLPNGIRVIGLPAKPETIRGFTGDVFLDEFAMHADDRAIWAAIFPTLLRGDGELDVASTPKGKNNLFYELSRNDQFDCTTVTLPSAVEHGLDIDTEAIRRSMGDDTLYQQEFLCEFLDESTAYLTYDQIAECEDATLEKDPTIQELAATGGELFIGIDVGRKHDLTVIWVLERSGGETLTTRAVYEHHNLPFREQGERIAELMSLKPVRRCCIDAGGIGMQLAETAVDDFGSHRVEPVVFTNAIKADLASRLRIAVEQHTIRVPVDVALRNDWHSLQRSITSAGQTRFDAARSATGHADRFWAAALAIRATGAPAGNQHCLNVKPLAFAGRGAW